MVEVAIMAPPLPKLTHGDHIPDTRMPCVTGIAARQLVPELGLHRISDSSGPLQWCCVGISDGGTEAMQQRRPYSSLLSLVLDLKLWLCLAAFPADFCTQNGHRASFYILPQQSSCARWRPH